MNQIEERVLSRSEIRNLAAFLENKEFSLPTYVALAKMGLSEGLVLDKKTNQECGRLIQKPGGVFYMSVYKNSRLANIIKLYR